MIKKYGLNLLINQVPLILGISDPPHPLTPMLMNNIVMMMGMTSASTTMMSLLQFKWKNCYDTASMWHLNYHHQVHNVRKAPGRNLRLPPGPLIL